MFTAALIVLAGLALLLRMGVAADILELRRTRGVEERLNDMVHVRDMGCVCDGVNDDTVSLNRAIAEAQLRGCRLIGDGTIRVTATVNMRGVEVDLSAASIAIDDAAAMLVIGGSSLLAVNPAQEFGSVTRTGGATVTPTCRVIGAKGQKIEFATVDYLQLYADTDQAADASIAYSEFRSLSCGLLELNTNPAPVGSTTQWINENAFWIRRYTVGILIDGTYGHNHNWFYHGTVEGAARYITINKGNSNVLWGIRAESGPTVTFAAGTWDNNVVLSYAASQRDSVYDTVVLPVVVDAGEANVVQKLGNMVRRRIPIVTINAALCQVYSNTAGGTAYERGPNYTSLPNVDVQRYGADTFHRANNRLVFDSPKIPCVPGDAFALQSDAAQFRPNVTFYDANMVQLTDVVINTDVRCSGGSIAGGTTLSTGTNVAFSHVQIVASRVAFVKFDIVSGTASVGMPFRRLSAHKITSSDGADMEGGCMAARFAAPCVSATPTIGFAPVGEKLSNVAGGWFTCTSAVDKSLAVAAIATDGTVTLTAAAGIAAGNIIGIELDTGAWHWTTVNGAPAGNVVTLAVAMPSGAAIGKRVTANAWAAT
jgi:hypothetical protein